MPTEFNPRTALGGAPIDSHLLLQGLSEQEVNDLLADCATERLSPGDVLISPGEQNSNLYLLMSGTLVVFLDDRDQAESFTIAPGECIGEMSIIEQRRTSARVVAETAATVVVMSDTVFWLRFMRLPRAVANMMGMLARRMRKTNEAIIAGLQARLEYERLQAELGTAARIQLNLLPNLQATFAGHPELELHASIDPARNVGGDLYEAFFIDSEHVCVLVGDVSGKGMPAALFMVRVMTVLRMVLQQNADLASAMIRINQLLCENNDEFMFVTLLVAVLNVTTGELRYVNGGHPPPFLSRAGEPYTALSMPRGMIAGIHEGAEYGVSQIQLQPGDRLLLYTDGVTEAMNTGGALQGEATALAALNAGRSPTGVRGDVNHLRDATYAFMGGADPADDITIFGMQFTGS